MSLNIVMGLVEFVQENKKAIGGVLAVLAIIGLIIYLSIDTDIIGRYVILERVENSLDKPDKYSNMLNVAEIRVLDKEGKDITAGSVVTTGSIAGATSGKSVVDNKLNTFTQTAGDDFKDIWIKLDLGADKKLDRVIVENRQDCCQIRIAGVRVRVVDNAGKDVFVGPTISKEASVQKTFEFLLK